MKWLTFETQREPGFRFNLRDLILILGVAILSVFMYITIPGTTLFILPLYVIYSFFLFCNVFRIGNYLEIVWYVPFVIIAGACIYLNDIRLLWILVLCGLEPLKAVLVFVRIKKGGYRGIGYTKINRSQS